MTGRARPFGLSGGAGGLFARGLYEPIKASSPGRNFLAVSSAAEAISLAASLNHAKHSPEPNARPIPRGCRGLPSLTCTGGRDSLHRGSVVRYRGSVAHFVSIPQWHRW